MDVKLLFLLFLLGVLVKIYDDLNDNNLFEYLNILKEKDYINNFLIGGIYICWTIIAFKEPVFFLGFTICNIFNMYLDKKAYEQPVEFIWLLLSILLVLYLLFFENLISKIVDELYLLCDIKFCMCFIIIPIFVLVECFLFNIEYSYKKLILRFLFVILFAVASVFLPNNYNYIYFFLYIYLLTSCIFQVILIRKDRIEKSLKKSKKEKKKRNQKSKKVKTPINQL